MLFNIYERVYAISELENEDLANVLSIAGLSHATQRMSTSKSTYSMKMELLKDKQTVLDNLMRVIDSFTASNTSLIAQASDLSARAIGFRINLEVSLLESQIKMLDIESLSIKNMTAAEFLAKYPA